MKAKKNQKKASTKKIAKKVKLSTYSSALLRRLFLEVTEYFNVQDMADSFLSYYPLEP